MWNKSEHIHTYTHAQYTDIELCMEFSVRCTKITVTGEFTACSLVSSYQHFCSEDEGSRFIQNVSTDLPSSKLLVIWYPGIWNSNSSGKYFKDNL
jgi:hypothetical protein